MSTRFAASALVLSLGIAACHSSARSARPAKAPAPSRTAQKAPDKKKSADKAKAQTADKEKPAKSVARNDRESKSEKAEREKQMREAQQAMSSDAQVLAAVLAYNSADISYARLAATRARSAEVREYARRMLRDYASINERAMELVTTTDLKLEDNQTTIDLREISAQHRDKLEALSGSDFDAAFVAGEAAYHESLLVRLDRTLLPASHHPELKRLVASVRPAIAAHLAEAEQLRQAMGVASREQ